MFDKIRKIFGAKPKEIKYTCACCGKEQHDWPALAYNTPDHYAALSDAKKTEIALLIQIFVA